MSDLQVAILSIAMRALSTRVMTLIALFLDAGIFSWAMLNDSWPRLAGAGLFAIATWCLVHLHPSSKES